MIGMVVLLMLGVVYIVGTTLYEERQYLPMGTSFTDPTASIPVERGTFSHSSESLNYQQMPDGNRSLTSYYDNRAYPGAPPSIPHPLISEKGIGGKACLQCHQSGGYVEQFKAFAPVVPHPEMLNCKQCHVPQNTNNLFKNTNWEKMKAPALHQVAMEGAPPVIPHDLDMRNNCLSCHAGPAAPVEIRVSHPERVNCRQCHVPKNTLDIFKKPHPEGEEFVRPNNTIGFHQKRLDQTEIEKIEAWVENKQN